jgi:hypothetical protein
VGTEDFINNCITIVVSLKFISQYSQRQTTFHTWQGQDVTRCHFRTLRSFQRPQPVRWQPIDELYNCFPIVTSVIFGSHKKSPKYISLTGKVCISSHDTCSMPDSGTGVSKRATGSANNGLPLLDWFFYIHD